MELEMNDVFSVPRDSSCCLRSGWTCDFHIGYGLDVIEEDALNEKFCIQVLRIMITKADTEIDELEKDLVFLQSELAWVEYDEWSQICCNILIKKVDNLYVTVRNLEDEDNDDVEVSLLTHRKPAEKVHELVKALLNDYFQEKDKEALDVAVLDRSDAPEHAAELLEESTKISDSDSYAIVKEEIQELSTPAENSSTLRTSLMLQEKKASLLETVKLRNVGVKDSDPQSLKPEAVHGDNKKELSSLDLKCSSMEEAKEMGFSLKDKNEFQILSLKSPDKRRHKQDMAKVQPAVITYFCRNAMKHVSSQSKKKKVLSTSDPKILSEQAEENSSTYVADIAVDSSFKPMGKIENLDEGPRNSAVKDSDSNACRHETDIEKGMATMWRSDLEVVRNEEVITCHTSTIAGVKILVSSSNPEGKGNPPKADKPSKIFLHTINNDALSLSDSTGLSGKGNNLDSRLATCRKVKGENSDIMLDASKHMSGRSGRRSNSDSSLALSSKEKGGNSDVRPDALQHVTDPCERSNSDSVLATVRQFKVENCDIIPTLGHTTGPNQGQNHSDSSLGKCRQAKGRYREMDQKLCDFAQKSVRKQCIKESNFILTNKIDSSYSSSETEEKIKPYQQTVKFEKDGLIDNEDSVLTSFLELQDEKDATTKQPDGGRVQLEEVQMAENAAIYEKVDLDLSVKRQKLKAKKKIESNRLSVQDQGFLSIELVSGSSLMTKAKRQWKSQFGSDSSSNQYLDRDITNKFSDNPCETEGTGAALDDNQILISKPQKKRKKNPSLPILVEIKGSTVETDLSISQSHPSDSAGKDNLSITASYSIDSCNEAVASSSFATSKLKNMKVGDLRMLAKEQKLTKYSKLRKCDLIERIVNHLGCC